MNVGSEAAASPLECRAFPALVRWGALAWVALVIVGALVAWPTLTQATWSFDALALMAAAGICIAWIGVWISRSRTRLEGDTLTQTWLWTRRVHAADVASTKLVHWPSLDKIVVPRLLVKQRNGGLGWFQASDARVLIAFMERVMAVQTAAPSSPPPPSPALQERA